MLRLILLCAITFIGALFAAAPSRAETVCLRPEWDNTFGAWVNACNFHVYVNWDDGNSCKNYACADRIGPNRRSPATLSRRHEIKWCENHSGEYISCKNPGAAGKAGTVQGKAAAGGGGVAVGGGGSVGGGGAAAPPAKPNSARCGELAEYINKLKAALPKAEANLAAAQAAVDVYNRNGRKDTTGYGQYAMDTVAKLKPGIAKARDEIAKGDRELASCS